MDDGVAPAADRAVSAFEDAVRVQRDLTAEELVIEAGRLGRDPRLASLSDAEVEAQLGTSAATIAAETSRYLTLLAEMVVRGVYGQQGARTPAQWLSWRLAVAPSTAREQVRVALRLRTLPTTAARLAEGTLSYSKVRAITRLAATPDDEALVLTWADSSTAAQLERIASATRGTQRRLLEDRNPDEDATYRWRTQTHHDGTATLTVRGPIEEVLALDGAARRLAEAAVADAEDPPDAAVPTDTDQVPTDTDEVPAPRVHSRDRFAALHDQVLAAAARSTPVDTSGLDAHTLVLQTHADALAGGDDAHDPTAVVGVRDDHDRVRAMHRATLRRIACEAGIRLAVVGSRDPAASSDDRPGVQPLDAGRRTRRPSAALRRAIHLRDQRCTFPSCHGTRNLHVHHVVHWADGGPTDRSNLVLLCSYHHRYVHSHPVDIKVAADGRHRFTHDGRHVPALTTLPPPGAIATPAGASAEALIPPGYLGDGMDLSSAVASLQLRYAQQAALARAA